MTQSEKRAEAGLHEVVQRLLACDGFRAVRQALGRGEGASIDGAWGSSCALITAGLLAVEPSTASPQTPTAPDAAPAVTTSPLARFRKTRSAAPESPPGPTASPPIPTARASASAGSKLRRPRAPTVEPMSAERIGTEPASPGSHGGASSTTDAAGLPRPTSVLLVLPRISEVDDFSLDFSSFAGERPAVLPAWETLPGEHLATDSIHNGRLCLLRGTLRDAPPRVVITSIAGLLAPTPSPDAIRQATRTIAVGQEHDPEQLAVWLVERGFERVPAVQMPGEFTIHGGIVDIFPPGEEHPYRLEYFGDEVESVRQFDVETQRRIADLKALDLSIVPPGGDTPETTSSTDPQKDGSITPSASEPSSIAHKLGAHHVADFLRPGTWVVLLNPADCLAEAKAYLQRLNDPRGFFSPQTTLARLAKHPILSLWTVLAEACEPTHWAAGMHSVERITVTGTDALPELARHLTEQDEVLIACHNAGENERLREMLANLTNPTTPPQATPAAPVSTTASPATATTSGPASHPPGHATASGPPLDPAAIAALRRVRLCEGYVLRGFRFGEQNLFVISDHELFGRRDIRRVSVRKSKVETRAIDSFLDLNAGDLVVHLTKGIARFHGMKLLTNNGQTEEHLELEFRDGVTLFVPVSLIHLVQKYVGGTKAVPLLSRLGSDAWERKKRAAANAVIDLASEMIQMQAQREAVQGVTFPPDTHWVEEFEAAFPYTATADQLTAVASIKGDMQRPRPMDRLVCGDVGFGKTEVAMRAAFKAVDAGKQVAVLVPTTVLAQQHFRTFCERMAEYPFRIEVLSRFKTKGEQKQILEETALGQVDILIGTHRIVQPDVKFADLGLLVIDEEQRFGVEAKESLKRLRLEVDVLTLSATPIPRTLHLSLLGVRDISNLETPPHDRLPIETRVCRFDRELIRNAMIREFNRGGQAYFVHNRIYDIETLADELQTYVPEARIGIAHGQMTEDELEESMLGFVNGQLDILVATTIIESGLDIPNANTMFIHEAHRYGLSDLHQLRGRVGRYKHRAYCYLLLEPGQTLTGDAAKRLKAIEEFSELGAGFKISMRDLEIRGAGNILGTEQSGHIASVGYELYCQLLEQAVARLKNAPVKEVAHVAIDLPLNAYLPNEYVPSGRPKIEVYRRLSRVQTLDQLQDFESELIDRFGPVPVAVQQLLELRGLQIRAESWGIADIHLEETYVVFGYRDRRRMDELLLKSRGKLRIVDHKSAYWPWPKPGMTIDRLFPFIKALLQRDA